ncbi:putative bifunctional diguanylate cyclase/phosphodiesterase [Ancylobacter sp. SL191]|uniref:putative bifunctional diguanylate cyclase/phosphodiesterase n=1 Tax=Ancylobacter sp. SL191 TaxID=2995166 RepID=UPI00226DC377|nr:EAL domain-containing protein [Ancylobacter sp. SL191]WAC27915.1 EAL domain-containing protein [Ancylobacter sp. SL191]
MVDATIEPPGMAGGMVSAGGTTASGLLSVMSGFIAGLFHQRPFAEDLAPLLARLGADLALSRAALFEVHSSAAAGLCVTCRVDWARKGLPLLAGNTHPPVRPDEADALQRDWAERRTRGEVIEGRTDDLTGYLRAFFEAAEIVSFYTLPVMVDGRWWGHFCVSSDEPARLWTGEERAGLQALTELIALAVERSHGRRALSEATRLAMLAAALDGIVTIDEAGQIVDFNPAAEAMFGYSRADVTGRFLGDTIIPTHLRDAHRAGMARYLAGANPHILGRRIEVEGATRGGRVFPIELTVTEIRTGTRRLFTAYLRDISDRRRAKEALETLAYSDTVTGLPNRAGLVRLMRQQGETVGGALVMRMSDLAILGASLGEAFAQQMIAAIAARLSGHLPAQAHLGRTGENEFAIIFPTGMAPERLGRQFEALMHAPLEVEGRRFYLDANLGLAARAGRIEQSLRDAEMACRSERAGRWRVFDDSLRADHQQRLAMEIALREALAAGGDEIYPVFQPVVESRSGRVLGFEALARWRSPRLGQVTPGAFIALAETAGLIDRIGELILERALGACARWNAARAALGQAPRFIAVNLAASQLTVPDLAERIAARLARHGVPGAMLHLELTESTLLAQPDAAAQMMHRLRALGCRIAIDDFGTGYSSFSYLQHLPADVLKIDRAFMTELATQPRARKILGVMIDLAHALGMSVVAEGIETVEALAVLEGLGGDAVQGFLTGHPMPLEAALEHPDGIAWARQG